MLKNPSFAFKMRKKSVQLGIFKIFRYCTKRLEPNRRLCLSRTGADPQHCRKNEYRYRTSEAKLSNTSTYSIASLPTWYKQLLYVVSRTITKHLIYIACCTCHNSIQLTFTFLYLERKQRDIFYMMWQCKTIYAW